MSLLSEVSATVVNASDVITGSFSAETIDVTDLSVENIVAENIAATGTTELFNTNIYGHLQFQNHVKITNVVDSDNNVSIGYNVGAVYVNGINNVAIGKDAGKSLTDGNDNVFIGDNAGKSVSLNSNNIGLGNQALASDSLGAENIGIGHFAGNNNIGDTNVAIGAGAMHSDPPVSCGTSNICIGTNTGQGGVGFNNIAVGTSAMTLYGDNENICIGINAGNFGPPEGLANGNIIIGRNSGVSGVAPVSNAVSIGNECKGVSGAISIGRCLNNPPTHTALILGYVDGSGNSNFIKGSYANDTEAKSYNVPLGGVYYRTTAAGVNVLQIRLTP